MNNLFALVFIGISAAYFLAKGNAEQKDVEKQIENEKQVRNAISTNATISAVLPSQFVSQHPQVYRVYQSFYNERKPDDLSLKFLPPPQF